MTKFEVDGKACSGKPEENLLQACLGAGLRSEERRVGKECA